MNLGSHLLQKLHGAEVVILEKFQKPSESKKILEKLSTVHVTFTRHSCMGAFSIWMKSLGQNNHGFLSWQFCRELNLEQNGLDKFF